MALLSKGKWSFIGLAAILASGLLIAIYPDRIKDAFVSYMTHRAQTSATRQIGSQLAETFLVEVGTNRQTVPLRSMLKQGGVVMLYKPGCSACGIAVDHYVAKSVASGEQTSNPYYVLSFDADAAVPDGLPEDRFLRAASPAKGSMFDTRVTPQFWLFDADGRIVAVDVGYSADGMDAVLSEPRTPVIETSKASSESSGRNLHGSAG